MVYAKKIASIKRLVQYFNNGIFLGDNTLLCHVYGDTCIYAIHQLKQKMPENMV